MHNTKTRRPNLGLLLSLGLCASLSATQLSAQGLQITGRTKTLIGVHATSTGTGTKTNSIPANTLIQNSASTFISAGNSTALASATISPQKARFHIGCNATGTSTYGSAGVYTDPTGLDGEVAVTFKMASAKKQRGRIVAVMKTHQKGFVWGALSEVIATVRIAGHDEGVCDSWFDIEVTREFAVELGPAGIEIEVGIETWGSAKTPMSYGVDVELFFIPGHQTNAYGHGCAHLHSAFPDPHHIDIFTTAAISGGMPTLLAIGTKRANGSLGGPMGCPILLQPLTIIAGPTTNLVGQARLRLPLPNLDFKILAQGAIYVPLVGAFQSTNGLELSIFKR